MEIKIDEIKKLRIIKSDTDKFSYLETIEITEDKNGQTVELNLGREGIKDFTRELMTEFIVKYGKAEFLDILEEQDFEDAINVIKDETLKSVKEIIKEFKNV